MAEPTRMRYPERAASETPRQRNQRLALQASTARAAQHEADYGQLPQPDPVAPVAVLKPSGELVMPFATFQGGDYGQLCHFLGLRPSRPHANAEGKDTRKRKGRRHGRR